MSQDDDLEVIQRQILRALSGEEPDIPAMARFKEWLEASDDNKRLFQQLQDDGWMADELEKLEEVETAHLREPLQERLAVEKSARVRRIVLRGALVAAATAILAVSTWLFVGRQKEKAPLLARSEDHSGQALQQDTVLPVNRATLELSDGGRIQLEKVKKGETIKQGNYTITKLDSNSIGYALSEENGKFAGVAPGSNTLSVPPGARWQVRLPDGTNAWVNAGSSLRYPLAFTGPKRKVELDGEAYFEVVTSVTPFDVNLSKMAGWEVAALGTVFNVRAIAAERALRATLGEGKIQVIKGADTVPLRPKQEAQVNTESSVIRVVNDVNAEGRFAWKNGHFYFEKTDLRTAMGEVAQWYGADEPRFEQGTATALPGVGSIGRDLTLRNLLKNMSNDNLHFSLENRTIVASR